MISWFFQVLNAVIFAGLMVYVIRKFIAPQLREAIVRKHREMKSLQKEQVRLATEQEDLEERIEGQEDEAMVLFKKINRWRNEVESKRKLQRQEDENLLNQAHAKARKQLKNYALQYTYAKVAPLVSQQLKKDLEQRFSDEAEGHSYIAKVLENL